MSANAESEVQGGCSAVYVASPHHWCEREAYVWGRATVTIASMMQMQYQGKIALACVLLLLHATTENWEDKPTHTTAKIVVNNKERN